jgi:type I restriction enzyme S subunit
MSYIEQLLEGAEIEWKTLGDVVSIEKGKQLNKNFLTEEGLYPAYNGGISFSGYTSTFNYDENNTIISQGGASAGFVNYVTTKFYANAHCYVVLPNLKKVENRFIYHFLKLSQDSLMSHKYGAGIPALRKSEILELPIPVPPLSVQKEILRILDSFKGLTEELKTELIARKKQLAHYRDQLLSFEDQDVEWKSLGEVFSSISAGGDVPKNCAKGQLSPTNDFPYPIYANATGSKGLYGYTDSYKVESDAVTISARGAKIGYHTIRSAKFTAIIRLIVLVPDESILSVKFLNYALKLTPISGTKGGIPQLTVPSVKKLKIPIPSEKEQKRIVGILDKFDTLTTSKTEGLPAEIEIRQKQYEYYRDILLTFPKPKD